ncbi:hypothetical protein KAX03_02765 [Candidatus Bathyarchaeota archaeon]|nr:hypothetical protein [Candidatus Bathyarchaeota archaeon]
MLKKCWNSARVGLSEEEFSVFWILKEHKVKKPATTSKKVFQVLEKNKTWPFNIKLERQLRKTTS